jgi:3'(2'), 5'-bisphosphate nucleotidase
VNSTDLLDLAIEASLSAGKAILEVYAQPVIDAIQKADQSPLTLADKLSNDIIIKFLTVTKIPILSEESLNQPWQVRKEWSRCWIVDPLDGTKEFIKKNGDFTVNIALAENGKPVMGVIFAPVTGEIFFGAEQSGAFKATLSFPEWVTIPAVAVKSIAARIPGPAAKSGRLTIVASRSHLNAETELFIDRLRADYPEMELISRGSSLKICMVAEGLAQVYPRHAPTMEWDTAAGQAIATAAGCIMYNPATGSPLVYNKEDLKNPWFVVDRGTPIV